MSDEIIKKDDNQEFNKFNPLISAKYDLDLIEQQMLDLSLANVKCDNNELYATLNFAYLKETLNRSDKMRAKLKDHCEKLRTVGILVEDAKNDRFVIMNLYTTALYHNGKVRLKFNNDLKNYIMNLQKNYTKLDVRIIGKFTKIYALRLYEFLISKMFDEKKNIRDLNKTYELYYSYPELFLTIQIAESSAKVQQILQKLDAKQNNYDAIYKEAYAVANKKYDQMGLIKQRFLNPAIEEINAISDINVVMQDVTTGRSHKIEGFKFFCTYKKKEELEKNPDVEDVVDENAFMDLLMQTYPSLLSFADMKAIAKAADFNVSKLRKAIEVEQNTGDKDNLPGFLIQAIKDSYEKKSYGKKKKNMFNDYEQSPVYAGKSNEELEEMLGMTILLDSDIDNESDDDFEDITGKEASMQQLSFLNNSNIGIDADDLFGHKKKES